MFDICNKHPNTVAHKTAMSVGFMSALLFVEPLLLWK